MLHDLDAATMDDLARRSAPTRYRAGDLIHRAGEPMTDVAFITAGRAKVFLVSRSGRQQTVVLLGPGDAFGEIGVVATGAQNVFVEAIDAVTVCRVPRDTFLRLISDDPDLALRLAEAIGEKLLSARERIADLAFRDIRGRVAHLIVTFVERDRAAGGDPSIVAIRLGMTHREISELLGTRRESVTLALASLEREGLVEMTGGGLRIVDEVALRAAAEA